MQQGLGPGIAGVATKYKGPSIKVYAERQKYQEWEFVYDPQKDGPKGTQNTFGQGLAPNSSNSSQQQQQNPAMQRPTGFGPR